ncbi:MAG: hypothetical protein WD118_05950 [Phycisphaeraceae bacterium]
MITKEQLLERERRWALIAGIASVAAVALILLSFGSSASGVRTAAGVADRLLEVDSDRSALVIASIIQSLGWFLLAVPLVYLFKAASARAPQVRRGLLGLVIVAPIFLGLGGLLSTVSVLDAATEFKKVPASEITACVGEKQKAGEATGGDQALTETRSGSANTATTDQIEECRDDAARDVRAESSVSGIETGLGLAGLLGFTIAVVYCSLWGMRTGLLTRFWGSLGMALGAVFVFFTLFTLVWFIYIGLLFAGWVPGGRPPAWASGEAMPWPKGGSRGRGGGTESGTEPDPGGPASGPVLEGFGEEVPDGAAPEPDVAPEPDDALQIERRKRKKRNG